MSEVFSFPPSWRWLDRPLLQLETGLKGHVVVVLYWRLGCVASRAALLELVLAVAGLQDQAHMRGQPVAVVAVHVPTCEGERDEERLRRAVAQLPAMVAVAIESDRRALARLPTMLLIDDQACVRGRTIGVPRRRRLRAAIDMLRREAAGRGVAVVAPFVPTASPILDAWWPCAIACDGDRVWVASAGQRRVFALDRDGKVTLAVGSGEWGCADGPAPQASFAQPVALCVHEEFLVVADAQTHTLRAIERDTGDVTTWSGTGRMGVDAVGGSYGCDQALSSPAGIVSRDGGLYVCQAGTDQLWQIDPMTGAAMAWLGGGVGGDVFAEPVALAQDGEQLWVTEARGRELVRVDLAHVQRHGVQRGFGRPAAVVVHGERVLVCDSWSCAVFSVAMHDGQSTRLFGVEHGLQEPVGAVVQGDCLYVADAAANAIFRCDLAAPSLELVRWPVYGLPRAPRMRRGPTAQVAIACSLREHSDVTLSIPTPTHRDGSQARVDVLDESCPVLAGERHEVTQVANGSVAVLLPVAHAGNGVLRVRLEVGEHVDYYVLPVTVAVRGQLEATLLLPS